MAKSPRKVSPKGKGKGSPKGKGKKTKSPKKLSPAVNAAAAVAGYTIGYTSTKMLVDKNPKLAVKIIDALGKLTGKRMMIDAIAKNDPKFKEERDDAKKAIESLNRMARSK